VGEIDKSVFPDEIEMKDLGMRKGTRKFKLLQPFRNFNSKLPITVQMGFITDGISSPKWAWSIVGPMGNAFPAALVHDWCFSPYNKSFGWKESNDLFLENMKHCGVGFAERWVIYSAVMLGSYYVWTQRFKNYGI
jgi:hypothetical protein